VDSHAPGRAAATQASRTLLRESAQSVPLDVEGNALKTRRTVTGGRRRASDG
jgi:hypothetical protein